jgi:hypothetical protein
MSNRQSVDLDLFQTFLANAFAVQESGLDRRSLSAVIEIQRFIAGDGCKLVAAMQMIVDRALGVAHASGVAIGMLEPNRNELVYKAGSGNAARDVGRRVPAVLSASSAPEMRREILRVENAASDTRIEAEICRQFGAMSLVMLPIYKERVLVGVLQALFETAHAFPEREIRAYRLMIGALEEAMLRSMQHAPETAVAVPVNAIPASEAHSPQVAQTAEHATDSALSGAFTSRPWTDECVRLYTVIAHGANRNVRQWAESLGDYRAIAVREMATLQSKLIEVLGLAKTHPLTLNANFRNAAGALGAALLLSIVVWTVQRTETVNGKISLSGSTSSDAQLQPSAKPIFGNPADETSKALGNDVKEATASSRGFRRVRVGPNEVDYVSEDVTIRKFEPIHPKPQLRNTGKEVNFGDDVTVRYFAKSPAFGSQSSSGSEATPVTKSGRSE